MASASLGSPPSPRVTRMASGVLTTPYAPPPGLAQHADGQARSRERLPSDDLVRQAEERRPLGQPRDVTELAGFVLEHRDELGSNRLALELGIRPGVHDPR